MHSFQWVRIEHYFYIFLEVFLNDFHLHLFFIVLLIIFPTFFATLLIFFDFWTWFRKVILVSCIIYTTFLDLLLFLSHFWGLFLVWMAPTYWLWLILGIIFGTLKTILCIFLRGISWIFLLLRLLWPINGLFKSLLIWFFWKNLLISKCILIIIINAYLQK